MANYIFRRLMLACLTLLCVTVLVFGLMRAMPGSPLTLNLEDTSRQLRKEDIEQLKEQYGLNKPWYVAYVHWLGDLATGDLGDSFLTNKDVTLVIGERIGPTLLLSLTSMLLTYVLSMPMGLYSSVRHGKYDERTLSTILYMLYSLPSFVTALLLQSYLSYRLGWFPLKGMYDSLLFPQMSIPEKVMHVAWHCVLPVFCYTYASWAYYSRFIRANMAEALQQDYVRTARAKGVGPLRVVMRHAFRNTMIPMATLIGLSFPALLSGSVILERIFTWPGMGQLFFESILNQDYNVIMGLTLVFSIMTLLGTLLADIMYAIVDPRISYH
ncbi:MAG: ABC transporter permease [Pirellula sp.]|nr:ABC transporter permease [Pirellula sp.]